MLMAKNVDGDKPRQPKNDQASKREASRLTALARRAVAKPKPSAKAIKPSSPVGADGSADGF